MDVFKAIKERRAVKHFDPEYIMPKEDETKIFEAALQSPTAFNIQNWRFVVVKDKALRSTIREAAWNQAQVTSASLFVILCADTKSWEKEPARYWKNAPGEVQDFLLPAIDGYYRNKNQVQRDEAMRSCGIVAQTLMLSAKAMGYDSCPMDGFDFEAVGKIINLPEDCVIAMFVAIGKGTKEPWPKGGQLPLEEVVIKDKF